MTGLSLGGPLGSIFGATCFVAGTQVVIGVVYREDDGTTVSLTARQVRRLAAEGGGVITALQVVEYLTAAIETLKEGDYVVSRDEHDADGSLVASRITRKYVRRADHLQLVWLEDGKGRRQLIRTTDEHPFHAVAAGWTQSQLLEVSDVVSGPAEITSAVTSNAREPRPVGVTVYNMEIEGTHTYFVRAEGTDAEPVWVHNASPSYALRQLAEGDIESGVANNLTDEAVATRTRFNNFNVKDNVAVLEISVNGGESQTIGRIIGPGSMGPRGNSVARRNK